MASKKTMRDAKTYFVGFFNRNKVNTSLLKKQMFYSFERYLF